MPEVRGERPECWKKDKRNSNNNSLHAEEHLWTQHVKAWSRWAAAAPEDGAGCHSCRLRTGNWGWKNAPCSEKSGFLLQRQNLVQTTWQHGLILPCVPASGWWGLSDALVPSEHCWSSAAYPSPAADRVHALIFWWQWWAMSKSSDHLKLVSHDNDCTVSKPPPHCTSSTERSCGGEGDSATSLPDKPQQLCDAIIQLWTKTSDECWIYAAKE